MKNILFTGRYNGIIGGIERYIQKSAALLRRNGFAVHYLYTEDRGQDQQSFAGSFDTIQKFTPENDWLKKADLVIVHNIIPPELLKNMPKKKTFFFAHDHNIYCQRYHYYWPVGRINCHWKRIPFICKVCSLGRNAAPPLETYRKLPALVLSDFMADNLYKNGFEQVVKLPAFIQVKETERTFMPDGILRILFLGQLIRGKGADLMLKTLSQLTVPFECTIAGDGNDRSLLEKMTVQLGLADKVRFTGFVSEPEKLWETSDVFFFPVRWQEPFGLVGMEAMAHGVPVVAFDTGGVREWLSDNETGFILPEKDTKGAAKVLTHLSRTPALLEKTSLCALERVREKFSEKCFIDKFTSLCEETK